MDKKIARIYMRVSTEQQNLDRQQKLVADAKSKGLYIAGIYAEKASGLSMNRPELQRLIDDLQDGDIVIAESIDRITRLPPTEAEKLIASITAKGAKIEVPEIFDTQELLNSFGDSDALPKYLIEPLLMGIQTMFLRIALNISYSDWETRRRRQKDGIAVAKDNGAYKGRPKNEELHKNIIELRLKGFSVRKTARTLNCGESTVQRVTSEYKKEMGKLDKDQQKLFPN